MTLGSVLFACSESPSVHKYYVEHENESGFQSFIIPSNIISLKEDAELDENALEALNSLQSMYVLRYSAEDDPTENGEAYLIELEGCIDDRYNEMMSMQISEQKMKVVFHEESGVISEIIAVIEQEEDFTLARLTGEIQLDQLIKVINKVDLNKLMTESNIENTWM